jgi:hypothetical protein
MPALANCCKGAFASPARKPWHASTGQSFLSSHMFPARYGLPALARQPSQASHCQHALPAGVCKSVSATKPALAGASPCQKLQASCGQPGQAATGSKPWHINTCQGAMASSAQPASSGHAAMTSDTSKHWSHSMTQLPSSTVTASWPCIATQPYKSRDRLHTAVVAAGAPRGANPCQPGEQCRH